jgi:hypothetical protein
MQQRIRVNFVAVWRGEIDDGLRCLWALDR